MTKNLSLEEGKILLETARNAIESRLRGEKDPAIDLQEYPPNLQENGAAFITLTKNGVLRGCVGTIEARQPLIKDVNDRALSAAFEDPRFPPLEENELSALKVEVSRLTIPEPLDYDSPEQLLGQLQPGVDGVILSYQFRRATFLPQVWNTIPDPELFLGRLCLKMGLEQDAWRSFPLEVQTYQVEKFTEE
jgi:AmmeMemoRadiSam system protein A